AGSVVLQDLLTGVRDRVVIAVTFLALLELVKRREVAVTQDEPWGPIVARPTTAAEQAGSAAATAPDAPIDGSLESFAGSARPSRTWRPGTPPRRIPTSTWTPRRPASSCPRPSSRRCCSSPSGR